MWKTVSQNSCAKDYVRKSSRCLESRGEAGAQLLEAAVAPRLLPVTCGAVNDAAYSLSHRGSLHSQ